ncbi:hypothetical protein [Rhodopirellula sallentina]
MTHLPNIIFALLIGSFASADAAPPEAASVAAKQTTQDWTFEPDPTLPNVLIFGDAISIGYTLQVREHLQGKANVFRPMR